MNWPAHPDDEWVEVTSLGDTEPRYILAWSGAAKEVADAKERYAIGHIDLDEFEAVVQRVLPTQ